VTKKSYVAENGITLGLAGLALLVIFAIALPRWTHGADNRAINLPDSLSSGVVLVGGKAQLPVEVSSAEISSVLDSLKKVDSTATEASEATAKSAFYLSKDETLYVQVVRAGAPSPLVAVQESAGAYSKVGDDMCFTPDASTNAMGQAQAAEVTCRRSESGMTIQVVARQRTAAVVPSAASVAKELDEIWSKVS
jgi:hypothetical protein